jgi:alkylation response protein AidB-like acyl-CoA dehydrogenase
MSRIDDVVERARALAPLLEQHRAYGEAHAGPSPEALAACREAGMFGLAAPVEVGGEEASLRQIVEVMTSIAAADPSIAWCMVNSTAVAMAAALLDPRWWPEVYQPPLPNAGLAAALGGRLTPTEGGYRLSGKWALMTGVRHAGWAAVNCRAPRTEGGPSRPTAIVPTSALRVTETWQDAVAMRGTGSHAVSAEDVFVPEGLVVELHGPPRIDRPLFRCSWMVRSAAINTGIPIGILEAALASAADELAGKVSTVFGTRAADSTALLEMMATATVALNHLREGSLAAVDALWAYVSGGQQPSPALRGIVLAGPFHAVDVARRTISELYARSSSAAFFRGHPLERALRDIHAVAYGLESLRPMHHAAGQIALGLDPQLPV